MYQYILFGIFILTVIGILAFLGIFAIHIKDLGKYSPSLRPTFYILLVAILILVIFGSYMILTGGTPTLNLSGSGTADTTQPQVNF